MEDGRRCLLETFNELLGAEGLARLSDQARREKNIRHGHISTLHVWWARRPLVAARAAVLGALLPEGSLSAQELLDLCRWEVHDGDPGGHLLLERVREKIRQRYPDGPPKVLDSMAGGGSIPLEALRLGCEAHAGEYNPVAYLILKATLEYPQRYGRRLAEEVQKWGDWVLEGARSELAPFYPSTDGATPIAYIWCRTVRCPNCGGEAPLFRQFWLARKPNKRVALKPTLDRERGRVEFQIVQGQEIDFDPARGTVRRARGVCLLCQMGLADRYLKSEAQGGQMGQRLIATVTTLGRGQGRGYCLIDGKNEEALDRSVTRFEELKLRLRGIWASQTDLVPDEPVPTHDTRAFFVHLYGHNSWGSLFNPRQLLALVTFGRLVRAAHQEMLAQRYDPELAKAVTTYLALAIDKLAERNCVLSRWHNTGEKVESCLDGHRLKMTWDYAESNPLSGATSSFKAAVEYMVNVAQREAAVGRASAVIRRSATELDGESMDAVVVDPPYYDNVPYADLSDFYYVWLRRTVGDLYPSDFQSPLTPKEEEITHNPARWGGGRRGEEISRAHYRRLLTLAFREMARVVKAGGPVVVMFTHRSLSAWEELLECLMDAGLYATSSFPVHTEMDVALGVMGKGSVKSTIVLCCRKRLRDEVGWFHELRQELREELRRRMEGFWQAGLRGANFFIAAMGPAIEVFGRHSRVLRPDGGQVTVREWLEEVHRLVADYALERLDGLGAVDPPTRFYVLWRWAYGNGVLEFDDARKLAIGVGAEIDGLLRASLLVGGDRVVAPIALERYDVDQARRVAQALAEGRERDRPLVDFVHLALVLWHRAEIETLGQLLGLAGLAESEGFWHSCQTILSVEEAFLAAARKGSRQTTLTEEDAESGEDEGEEGSNRVAGGGLAMLEREVTLLRQLLGAKTTIHRQLRML